MALQDFFTLDDKSLNVQSWKSVNIYNSIHEYENMNKDSFFYHDTIAINEKEKENHVELKKRVFNAISNKCNNAYILDFIKYYVLDYKVKNDRFYKTYIDYKNNVLSLNHKLRDYPNNTVISLDLFITKYNVIAFSLAYKNCNNKENKITMPSNIMA